MTAKRTVRIAGKVETVTISSREQLRQLWHKLFTDNFTLEPPLTDAQIAEIVSNRTGRKYERTNVATARNRFNKREYGPIERESTAYRG